MKQITIFQKEDIDKFKEVAGYFLEGREGVFNLNGLPMYSHSLDTVDEFVKISKLFELYPQSLNDKLKTHLIKEKDFYRKEITQAKEKINTCLNRLDQLDHALQKANNNKSFMDTFIEIISE